MSLGCVTVHEMTTNALLQDVDEVDALVTKLRHPKRSQPLITYNHA